MDVTIDKKSHLDYNFLAAKEEEKSGWQKMREGINNVWSAFRQDEGLLEQVCSFTWFDSVLTQF